MIDSTIRLRRTIKPSQMTGQIIPDETVANLLELADWAPTHGRTEPWRFIVYSGEKMKEFSQEHADLYKQTVSPEKYMEASYDKLVHGSDGASHLVIAYIRRGANPNIPEIEELASVAAAIQNILLGATADGLAGFWSTSGMVHNEAFKDYLQLREEDIVLGILYLGYTDEPEKRGKAYSSDVRKDQVGEIEIAFAVSQ